MKHPLLAADISASGLWASYGDAAPFFGIGGARAMGQANWERINTRLARKDGTTYSEDPSRSQHWMAKHPAEVLVDIILGYSHGPGAAKPPALRLTVDDLRALTGEVPSTSRLRLAISGQALRLESWLEANPHHPYRDDVEAAFARARTLHTRLWATR